MVCPLWPDLGVEKASTLGFLGVGLTYFVRYPDSQFCLLSDPLPLVLAYPFCPGNLLGHWVVYGGELYSPPVGLRGIALVSARYDCSVTAVGPELSQISAIGSR